MGSKHNKKRFLIIKYSLNMKGTYDELVELSKKNIGSGKLAQSGIVLDLVNKEVLKCEVPGAPSQAGIPYENVYEHFHKTYGNMIDQFVK
jgi:hypothetical protein